jgi:N-acetylmuramoyl-L-alanine amidase
MIRLKQILTEAASNLTLNDLWSGKKLKYGDMQKQENSALRQIQQALINKFPEYAKSKKMSATGYFGPKTATMIGMLWGQKYSDLTTVEIGSKTLEKLGFKHSTGKGNSAAVNIIATTLVLEAGGEGAKGMQAIANVLQNRAKARGTTPSKEALRNMQFSMWNAYNAGTESMSDVIARAKSHPLWKTAVDYAKRIATLTDITGGATHYYNPHKVKPSWGADSNTWKQHKDIGNHKFGRDTTVSWARV